MASWERWRKRFENSWRFALQRFKLKIMNADMDISQCEAECKFKINRVFESLISENNIPKILFVYF